MASPEDGALLVTELEALALIEEELRRRHVESRTQGIVRLPRMLPKPVPPPEFWTRSEDSMGAPLRSPVADAVAELRALMRARRFGKPYSGGSDDGE